MGLISKFTEVANQNKLTTAEYEFLFSLIKSSNFKGEHLELVYNLTIKLQNQYLLQKDQEK
jgi:hypothetical protein